MTRQPLRVLVLEHTAADAELNVVELERAGFETAAEIVGTREEYLAKLRYEAYDLVLADYRLPDWTGIDALAALQSHGRDIPFILVTGTLGEERAVECVKLGAADFILKQNLARLPLAVRRALDERRVRAERARTNDLVRKLTLAVDQSPAAVIITDTAGTIEYVNQRFTELTGYAPEESLGRSPRLLKAATTPAEVYRDMWHTLRDGRVWQGEIQNRTKAGELHWHALTIAPVRDPAGAVTHFVSTQEDVSERKRAERELRDREERFRQLAENIKEVFFLMDVGLNEMLYINPAYETIWGRSRQSLYDQPRSFVEAIPVEDRAPFLAGIARIQQGGQVEEMEFRVIRPDGQTRWVRSHAVPVRNDRGEVYRISGVALDVTEARRVQEALVDSEALYRTLTDASFDAILLTEDGIVLEANRGFAELCGTTLDQVIGRPVTDFVPEESRDVRDRKREGLEGSYETVGRRTDGRKLFLEATARTHITRGRRTRLTALRDVTEKRALERQYQQAQKMEAVGRLASGVAHDFNNMLTVITAYSDLLLEDLPPGDPRRDDLEQIRQAATGAGRLTRQLLAFSRQQVVEPRRLVLEDGVRSAQNMLGPLIGENIELVTELSDDPATVKIDPGQLEQVIMNLAVNARDAMPSGGTLRIQTATVRLANPETAKPGPEAAGVFGMLEVTDSGIGMDESTRARIFEPFFTTKDPDKGTGLGLATVYGIVKQNGGFIAVESEPGLGTTFRIYLPRLVGPAERVRERESGAAPRGSETILLVEDAAAVREAARQILERCGYAVLEAPSPQAALAFAARRRDPIHLLLTDIVMPRMSGRELATELTGLHPEVKVLYMSGYTDDAPGSHYLQKPFSPDALARKVRGVLDGGRGAPARRPVA